MYPFNFINLCGLEVEIRECGGKGLYSKIIRYSVRNFMSIEEADLEIDSGIISFCGYNDSGKSALIKGLEILMYDSYSKLQTAFIKTGKSRFKLEVEFDDGVVISKEKSQDSKGYWCMYRDGELVYHNKEGTGFVSTNGVPDPIRVYWGVLEDENTNQKLNVRKNTDKLFLVHTTGGENYKALNVVLQSEVMTDASKLASQERLETEKSRQKHKTMQDTYTLQMLDISILSDDMVQGLQNSLVSIRGQLSQKADLDELKDLYNTEIGVQLADECTLVDTDVVSSLREMFALKKQADIVTQPRVKEVSVDAVEMLREMLELKKHRDVVLYGSVTDMDFSEFSSFRELCMERNRINELNKVVSGLADEAMECSKEVSQLCEDNAIQICKNCGEMV